MNIIGKYNPKRTIREIYADSEYYGFMYKLYQDTNNNNGWNDKQDAFK